MKSAETHTVFFCLTLKKLEVKLFATSPEKAKLADVQQVGVACTCHLHGRVTAVGGFDLRPVSALWLQ